MKLVKIRDKYMYKPITPAQKAKYNPNGVHTYLVNKDKRSGEVRAIRTTHMYEPQKEKLLEKGGLMVVKLPKIKYPSGIRNGYVTTDINGNPLDLKAVNAINFGGEKAVYVQQLPHLPKRRIFRGIFCFSRCAGDR